MKYLQINFSSGRTVHVNVESDGISVSLTGVNADLTSPSEGLCSELSSVVTNDRQKSKIIEINR